MNRRATAFQLVSTAAVAAAALLSFGRVFTGWDWLLPALLAGWLGLGSVRAARRTVPMVAALTISLLCGVWFTLLVMFPDRTRFGIPVASTLSAAVDAIAASWEASKLLTAPIEPLPGSLTLLFFGAWVAGAVSGGLIATRARVAAVLPWIAICAYAGAVGTEDGRLIALIIFIAALLLFAFAESETKEPRVAARVALSAVAAAAVVVPMAPGYGSDPVFALGRTGGSGIIAPFSEVRSRLASKEPSVMFRVRADNPSYWRLTALEEFDGTTWQASPTLRRIGRFVGLASPPQTEARTVRQRFLIEGLRGRWLPVAYAPSWIDGVAAKVDSERGTIFVDALHEEMSYVAISNMPEPTREQLAAATVRREAPLQYQALPPGFPQEVVELAQRVTASAPSPYEKAVALQGFLRGFSYSLDAPSIRSHKGLVEFLTETRVGYCESFATSMAVLLRSVGIPSRVAVGFLPGHQEGEYFTVINRDAHAWTEAYFDGIGWVMFEPTPRSETRPPQYSLPPAAAIVQGPLPDFEVAPGAPAPAPARSIPPVDELDPNNPPQSTRVVDAAKTAARRTAFSVSSLVLAMALLRQAGLRIPLALASGPARRVSALRRDFFIRTGDAFRRKRSYETEREYAEALLSSIDLRGAEDVIATLQRLEHHDSEPSQADIDLLETQIKLAHRNLWVSATWPARVRMLLSPSPLVARH